MNERSDVQFHIEASVELDAALAWYAVRGQDSAREFRAEILGALEKIVRHPRGWPADIGGSRRYVLSRFPYVVIYRLTDDGIRIVAVAHARRRQRYWTHRLHD